MAGSDEFLLLVGIASLPALLFVAAAVRQTQFFGRYGMCGVIAISALIPWALHQKMRSARAVATLLVFALVGNVAARIVTDSETFGSDPEGRHLTGVHPVRLKDLDRSLPIVASSALTFTEMTDRESDAVTRRTFYLTGGEWAVRYAHATIFESEEKVHSLLGMRGSVAPVNSFLQTHQQFYLIGNYTSDEEWLPRAMVAQKTGGRPLSGKVQLNVHGGRRPLPCDDAVAHRTLVCELRARADFVCGAQLRLGQVGGSLQANKVTARGIERGNVGLGDGLLEFLKERNQRDRV